MPDRLVTSFTNLRLAILCAMTGMTQIGLAQISPGCAASFTTAVSEAGQTIVLLDGRIERGDGTKLALIVTALDNQGRAVSTLYLNSPGGSGHDDREMAALVRRFKISTIVADGAVCVSACFTVFAAGHRKLAGYHVQIGVHRTSQNGKETDASVAATAENAKIIRELGVPPAIVDKLMQTPPDRVAWLTPGDLQSMNVAITGMLRRPVPLEPATRPVAPRRLTPFKPDGLSWSEYVAEASELSRRTFGPTYLREACNLYTALCSRSFVFIDAEDVRTHVTADEDKSGNIVRREVCKSNLPGGARSCLDWDTLEKYYSVAGRNGGREKRKRLTGESD
jgi:hypothetical protein